MMSFLVLHRPLMLFCVFWALTRNGQDRRGTSIPGGADALLIAAAAAWAAVLAPLLPLVALRLEPRSGGDLLFVSRAPFWLALVLGGWLTSHRHRTTDLAVPLLVGAFLADPGLIGNGFSVGGLFEGSGVLPLLLLLLPVWPVVEALRQPASPADRRPGLPPDWVGILAVLGSIHLLGLFPGLLGVWAARRVGGHWPGCWRTPLGVGIGTAFWQSAPAVAWWGSPTMAVMTWAVGLTIIGLLPIEGQIVERSSKTG